MPTIRFETKLFKIHSWTILKLPLDASAKLPSRGQVMVKGTINDVPFRTALEPDGRRSHWFRVSSNLQKSAKVGASNAVTLAIESTKEWPEPIVPADWQTAIDANQQVQKQWTKITPMARWEWIRWIGSTAQPETRQRRIETSCSKLLAGERRPCCFNRSANCVPEVSKNGVLLEPSQTKK